MLSPRPRLSRILTVVFTVFTIVTMTLWPVADVAHAQLKKMISPPGGGLPTLVTGDVPATADSVWENILYVLGQAAIMGLMNAAEVFMGQLAYDAAIYVASGGKGQQPLFETKSWGPYLENLAGAAAGEFIGTLSDSSFFKNLGINLCRPSNPILMLNLQVGLGNMFPNAQARRSRPIPKCNVQDIMKNYQDVYQSMSNTDNYTNLSRYFNTNTNDLGISVNIFNAYSKSISTKLDAETLNRQEGNGIKALTDSISGKVKTPSQVIASQMDQYMVKNPSAQQSAKFSALMGSVEDIAIPQLINYTVSMFLNTLSSRFMQMIFQEGLLNDLFKGSGNTNLGGASMEPDTVNVAGKTDARKANIDIRNPVLFKETTVEVIGDLAACPSSGRNTWNCAMDQSLSQAVRTQEDGNRMTIKEALDRDYLHGSWQLIPSTMYRENQDEQCYNYAYCLGNLKKLRLMRILPIGMEFAADSKTNIDRCASALGCVTLKEVVDGFNKPCSLENPWCKLVDPNWLITSFPQKCALDGFGDTLLSSQINQRRPECADIQTCLKRDDAGTCVGGYGYCMAEKNVYRFNADECPERDASCRVYADRSDQTVSYLKNTLDYGTCTADNVGCLWYATTYSSTVTTTENWVGTTTTGPRIYFDKTLGTCPADQDGCTKLFSVKRGEKALNLLINPSFERVDTIPATTAVPQFALSAWLPNNRSYVAPTAATGTVSIDGVNSYRPAAGVAGFLNQIVTLAPSRLYTLSFYARRNDVSATASTQAQLQQYKDDNATVQVTAVEAARDFRSEGCDLTVSPSDHSLLAIQGAPASLAGEWARYECSFLTASSTRAANVTFSGTNILLDSVQLEESEFATDFVDGLDSSLPVVNLKVAPDEFACTGNVATDRPACARYAQMCTQVEAGCQGYRDQAGNPEIPAMVSTNDLCPQSCVGYAEYRKRASSFDLIHESDPTLASLDDPSDATSSYFIPATGRQCTQAEVGCEEFTNVAAAGAGGETAAYFSYVRACEKPSADSQTYFTWEGSESAGYQLRTWSLKKRTTAMPGAVPPEGASIAPDAVGPRILLKRTTDQLTLKVPSDCNDASWRLGTDPDCRQFYDAAGHVYYRFYSQTVLSTPDCDTFRLGRTNQYDCTRTGGTINTATGDCLYQVYQPESLTCGQTAVGCRAYAGSEAGNVQTVLTENFRSSTGTFMGNVRLSSEALLVGDKSLRLDVIAGRSDEIAVDIHPSTPNSLYRVTFWAKAPGNPTTVILQKRAPDSTIEPIGGVDLTSDWQRYTVGLFSGLRNTATTTLVWTLTAPSGRPVTMFLDEVSIQKMQDLVYEIRDSWTTPNECDISAGGVPEPQAMLGCKLYTDRKGNTVTVRRFTRLCREAAIGCTGFIDTRNSDEVSAQTFVQKDTPAIPGFGVATTTRLADRYLYLIDEPSKYCSAENASCRAFGQPVFSQDRQTISTFQTVYYKDDITQYGEALCKPSELFCEEYTHNDAKEYFRDPQNHVCQYKENIEILDGDVAGVAAGTYSGWFQSESNKPCYPEILESGSTFNILRTGDILSSRGGYRGYAGLCPAEMGECTEFRDPNDKTDPLRQMGKQYFFIRNEKIDLTTCGGNVDTAKGCVLLRDMTDTQLKYNTAASYGEYIRRNYQPTPPINCISDSSNPACRGIVNNKCSGTISYYLVGFPDIVIAQTTMDQAQRDYERIGIDISPALQCNVNADCVDSAPQPIPGFPLFWYRRNGTCGQANDANLVVKVGLDRDCAQWLGCSSSETVFDTAQNKYQNVCTNLAMCDQVSNKPNDVFCGRYVDRSTTSTEPILAQGTYFDEALYQTRSTGFGQKDYSGYTLPDAFQVPDLVSIRVAFEGLSGVVGVNVSSLAQDYRLAAAVRIPPIARNIDGTYYQTVNPYSNQAEVVSSTNPLARSHLGYTLCRHLYTGRIGFFRTEDAENSITANKPLYCYLSLRGTNDSYDFQNLSNQFTSPSSDTDTVLKKAFPAPECRLQPEADSPFPASYVTDWDTTKNPPTAMTKAVGYAGANVCEFGEDCSCAYKRATYEGLAYPLFYGTNAQSVPPGICQGGPRDGQSCLPDTIFKLPDSSTTGAASQIALATAQQVGCGTVEGGGTCTPFSKVEIVRGVFGQCLERDITRTVGGSRSLTPCLTWNPTPVQFGQNDVFHYIPGAGFMPPQNSGQYYCTSQAKPPSVFSINADMLRTTGRLTKLDFDEDYIADAGCFAFCSGNKGTDVDGGSPKGTYAGHICEQAKGDQNPDYDYNLLRLVNAGRSPADTYLETFVPVQPSGFAGALYGAASAADTEKQRTALLDKNFSFFKLQPRTDRLCCSAQPDWVDGIGDVCGDDDKRHSAYNTFAEKFSSEFTGILSSANEGLFAGTNGDLLPVDCYPVPGLTGADKCYLKYWETGYRDKDQRYKFIGLTDYQTSGRENVVISSLGNISNTPYTRRCDATKPYFSIRAVFETKARTPSVAVKNTSGPWSLAGFWVTTCSGQNNNAAFMYFYMFAQSADTCTELAEVRSSKTNQDAAFTDRVWSESNYTVPGLGIQYNTRWAPFSSALNTGLAEDSKQPLFQSGSEALSYSKINPPTFLSPGLLTYYGTAVPQAKNKWAYLSNLYARIYRIYRYYDTEIGRDDSICTNGPNKYKKCTIHDMTYVNDAGVETTFVPPSGQSPDCGKVGVCSSVGLPPPTDMVCNSLSGMNSGLACGNSPESCHLAPLHPLTKQPLYTACELSSPSNWRQTTGGDWEYLSNAETECAATPVGYPQPSCPDHPWHAIDGRWHRVTLSEAIMHGAFQCANSAVKNVTQRTSMFSASTGGKIYCRAPGENSSDCPLAVPALSSRYNGRDIAESDPNWGKCVKSGSDIWGFCKIRINGENPIYTSSTNQDIPPCLSDVDCTFTEYNHWQERDPNLGGNVPSIRSGFTQGVGGVADVNYLKYTYDDSSAMSSVWCDRTGICTGVINFPELGHDPDPTSHFNQQLRGGYTALTECRCYNRYYSGLQSTGYPAWPAGSTSYLKQYFPYGYNELLRFPSADYQWNQTRRPDGSDNSQNALKIPIASCVRLSAAIRPHDCDADHVGSTECQKNDFDEAIPSVSQIGQCQNGTFEGNTCLSAGVWNNMTWNSSLTCGKDPSIELHHDNTDYVGPCNGVATNMHDGTYLPLLLCAIGDRSPSAETNLNKDNNACTHSAGYHPVADPALCPNPTDEFCGLITYKFTDVGSYSSGGSMDPNSNYYLPTDVTLGSYSPTQIPGFSLSGLTYSSAFSYIDTYSPRPPRIAAPDTRNCPSPGQCPIQRLDRFAFNGQSEGSMSSVGGQFIASIKFYGWAAHNQMPIRQLFVDWGDGSIQSFPDAKIKNHKPFCANQKECWAPDSGHTGLTCNTDNDCPAGAGTCKSLGVCNQKQSIYCTNDTDCNPIGTGTSDTCNLRTLFGNDSRACDSNYFDFQHLYTCDSNSSITLPSCSGNNINAHIPADLTSNRCYYGPPTGNDITERTMEWYWSRNHLDRPTCTPGDPNLRTTSFCAASLRAAYAGITEITPIQLEAITCGPPTSRFDGQTTGRCSRDPNRFCGVGAGPTTADQGCAPGDTCVANGLAPTGGCWDSVAKTCRFTPRLFLEDNWGWCSGECRALSVGGTPQDPQPSSVLHPYGGCWSGETFGVIRPNIRSNKDTAGSLISKSECNIDNPPVRDSRTGSYLNDYLRPWIVYPGSLQLSPNHL